MGDHVVEKIENGNSLYFNSDRCDWVDNTDDASKFLAVVAHEIKIDFERKAKMIYNEEDNVVFNTKKV